MAFCRANLIRGRYLHVINYIVSITKTIKYLFKAQANCKYQQYNRFVGKTKNNKQ